MKLQRAIFRLLLVFAPAAAMAQTMQSSLWQNVSTTYPAPQLQPASLTDSQRTSIRALLVARRSTLGLWECDDQSWVDGLTYSKMPVASQPVLLVEASRGCARGGQGANGAMWLIDWNGNKPRLIAAPDKSLNGWLYSIQSELHLGFHDLVLRWHMGARETVLSYFRYYGTAYKRLSSATLISDDEGNGKIVQPQNPQR